MSNKIISKIISGAILCSMITYTIPVLAYTKDETVYTKLDKNGNKYQTIVSTHIENEDKQETIRDVSDLINIQNTNGEEEYIQNENSLEWKAQGSDIYYQGESSKELPVTCKVKYELDGKEISNEEILGKSGKVKITLEYINNEERVVNISGKSEKMYVPFVVATGTIIDNSKNTNIEVSNGKIVNDGSKTIVMGLALPGMQESLGISKNDIELPSKIEITMDTTDFQQNNIATYITPKILEESDLEVFDKLDELYKKVNILQKSSKALVEGTNTLSTGTEEYNKKSKEFNSAMGQIATGVTTANKNYKKIDTGISSLSTGSKELKTGVETLDKGITDLSTALNSLPSNANALYTGSQTLEEGINGKTGLIAGVKSLETTLETALTTSIGILASNNTVINKEISQLKSEEGELESQINTLKGIVDSLSGDEKQALNKTIKQLETRKNSITSRITGLTKQEKTNEAVISKLQPTKESQAQLKTLNEGMDKISTGVKTLKTGLEKLNTSAKQLPTNITKLEKGSSKLVKGTKTLSSGASTLDKGASKLKTGINSLDKNTQKLSKASNELTKASGTISEGAKTLSSGMNKFNNEGIQTICNYINGDVKDITKKAEKLQNLANEYNNFTMLKDGNKGDVKFIMILDAIKHQEERDKGKEDAVLSTDTSNNDKKDN